MILGNTIAKKRTILKVGSEEYVLEKIKLKDRLLFLEGCKVLGHKCHCCFPFWCGHYTKEYEIANKFFEEASK